MDRPRRLADSERDGTLFVRDLGAAPELAPVRGAMLRAARPDDAPALQEAMEASGLYPPDIVTRRLRDGRRPYILETDDLIASYGWIAFDPEPIGDIGISFQLEPGESYIYDCATRPAYRGRGYYPALLRVMLRDLHSDGLRRVWIATAPGNIPSQHGIVHAGFAKVADVNIQHQNGAPHAELYGVPGVPDELLDHAAWSFSGHIFPETGIPAD